MSLPTDASNDVLTNTIAEDEERNSEVLVETRLAEAKINETGADIIFTTFAKYIPMNDNAEETIIMLEVENENEPVSSDDQRCTVCGQGNSGAHSCSSCSKPVHVTCGNSLGEEGYGAHVLCRLCQNEQFIVNEREQAHRGIKRAAEKMVNATAKKLPLLEIRYFY